GLRRGGWNGWSLLPAKNATDLLSGDQKGNPAPSVPATSLAAGPSSGRTQSEVFPFAVATKATVLPSGDKETPPLLNPNANCAPSGGLISKRYIRCSTAGCRRCATTQPPRAPRTSVATLNAGDSRARRVFAVVGSGIPPATASSIQLRASPIACNLCLRSLVRHLRSSL